MNDKILRSWAEIDLQILRSNYHQFKARLQSGKEIMAVVKADAYGHGDKEVVTLLSQLGVKYFAVSNIDEAIVIRNISDTAEILVLGYTSITSGFADHNESSIRAFDFR